MVAIIITVLLLIAILSEAGLKPNILKYLNLLVASIFATALSFAFFEQLAAVIISKNFIPQWSSMISFFVIFAFTLVITWVIADLLVKEELKVNPIITRVITLLLAGLFTFVLAGGIIVTLSLAPLKVGFPYRCYPKDAKITTANVDKPSRAFLAVDRFTAGMFSVFSSGSLSGTNEFSTVHPDFVRENFLNRTKVEDEVMTVTGKTSIRFDSDRLKAVRPSHTRLKDTNNELIRPEDGFNRMNITVNFSKGRVEKGGPLNKTGQLKFTLSQIKVLSRDSSGKIAVSYPVGYINADKKLVTMPLNETLSFGPSDYDEESNQLAMILNCNIPEGYEPFAVGFKQNQIFQLPIAKPNKSQQGQES